MSQGGLPGVVFDTMILYQATANLAGPAAELLRRLEAGNSSLNPVALLQILTRPPQQQS